MNHYIESDLTKTLVSEISIMRMQKDLEKLCTWSRYSGSKDGESAARYIYEVLKSEGIDSSLQEYELNRSLPLKGEIQVVKNEDIRITGFPAVYSGEAKDLIADVIFDRPQYRDRLSAEEIDKTFASYKGKIIITYDFSFNFYYKAAYSGALAIIAVWPNELNHHDTMGGVWGTSGLRDTDCFPYLPYVEVTEHDIANILSILDKHPLKLRINISMDNRIVRSSMPIALIKGKSKKFVLLSGHYDSWHEGATDNAAANVLMMEAARLFNKYSKELNRSVVIAWWSGHSDARYSGSTWFYDNNWELLRENCVAHINMDICGCQGSNAVRLDMTGMEGNEFNDTFLSQYNSQKPFPYHPLDRSSDQTFWGAGVPISIAPQFFVNDNHHIPPTRKSILEDTKYPPAFGIGGPFFWWHTKEDTIDKVDRQVLIRDCRIAVQLVNRYVEPMSLPIDILGFIDEMSETFIAFSKKLSPNFDLSYILSLIKSLRGKTVMLLDNMYFMQDTDDIIKKVAGELVRLKFTYSSPYYHDFAVEHMPFAVFWVAAMTPKCKFTDNEYLSLKTDFIRQRNRLIGQIRQIEDHIDCQLAKWALMDR